MNARGVFTFVNTADGPTKTSSARVTASYRDTLLAMRQPSPTTTAPPTYTFWPSTTPAPSRAPGMTWQKCQTWLPRPSIAPSSTTAVGWMNGAADEAPPSLVTSRLVPRHRHRRAARAHRGRARLQHAHDVQALASVAARTLARRHARHEVLALGQQRLARRQQRRHHVAHPHRHALGER